MNKLTKILVTLAVALTAFSVSLSAARSGALTPDGNLTLLTTSPTFRKIEPEGSSSR